MKFSKVMQIRSTSLLRSAILAMGAFILFLCVLMADVFIRPEKADGFQPLVLALYVASLPYYFALYQAWLLLNYIDKKQAFTMHSVLALQTIKRCAIIISGLFIAYQPLFMDRAHHSDAPGIFAIGLFIAFLSAVIATFTGLLQKLFQNAVDIKSENDLTV